MAIAASPAASRHRLINLGAVRTVLSLWAWFVLGVVVIVWTPLVALVWLVTLPFDKGHYAAGYLFRKLTVAHQVLNPLWTFRTTGTNIADPRRPYVVVANHQSFVDILLISHLPWEMKWLSKATFFKIPLIGWMMRMAGDIRLVRGERDSVIAAMAACGDRLQKRVSVMIFPTIGTAGTLRDLPVTKNVKLSLVAGYASRVFGSDIAGASPGSTSVLRASRWAAARG